MKVIKSITLLLAFIGVTLAGMFLVVNNYNNSPGLLQGDDYFKIIPGENGLEIAARLESEGFIKSAKAFSLYARLRGTGGKMKSGYYRIPAEADMKEIHDLLLQGRQVLYTVTIPEGWTIKQIGARLEETGITSAEDFYQAAWSSESLNDYGIDTRTAEGFLFPDTYSFPLDFPASKVVDAMVSTFFERLVEITDYSQYVSEDFYKKIILASIVEKEYRIDDEAAMIASVFYNRLKTDMNLGSCASVVYIITDVIGKPHPETLYYSDLEIESEYNTYLHPGLPPAPISNPGYTALKAAFFPEESDYYYFLLKDADAGRHYFSKTYGEHNQAYSLYIKKG